MAEWESDMFPGVWGASWEPAEKRNGEEDQDQIL